MRPRRTAGSAVTFPGGGYSVGEGGVSHRGHVRSRRRVEAEDPALLDMALDPRPDASERLLADERQAALDEAFAALPDETREVLTLFYREGQSAAQVAALLELSEDAVKKRLSRARTALRGAVLERLGDTLGATTPGAAFVTAVMSSLPLAAPLMASALTVTASKSASGASGGVLMSLGKLLPLLGGAAAGASGGVAGVAFGVQRLLKDARDSRERRALRRFRLVAIAVVRRLLGRLSGVRDVHRQPLGAGSELRRVRAVAGGASTAGGCRASRERGSNRRCERIPSARRRDGPASGAASVSAGHSV